MSESGQRTRVALYISDSQSEAAVTRALQHRRYETLSIAPDGSAESAPAITSPDDESVTWDAVDVIAVHPDHDGLQLTTFLQSIRATSDAPMVLMPGFGFRIDPMTRRIPDLHVMPRPIETDELMAMISRLAKVMHDRRRQQRAA